MNTRLIFGSFLSYLYSNIIGKCPLNFVRNTYLCSYLASTGHKTSIQMNCRFLNGRRVYLGDRNIINFGCLFDGRHYAIRTGSDVSIGPEATILTLGHAPQSTAFANRGGDVIIGDRAWIAYRAIILPGVIIGEGAVVGAGAVVSKNVEPFSIVAGNPAKLTGYRNRDLDYELDYRPFLQ